MIKQIFFIEYDLLWRLRCLLIRFWLSKASVVKIQWTKKKEKKKYCLANRLEMRWYHFVFSHIKIINKNILMAWFREIHHNCAKWLNMNSSLNWYKIKKKLFEYRTNYILSRRIKKCVYKFTAWTDFFIAIIDFFCNYYRNIMNSSHEFIIIISNKSIWHKHATMIIIWSSPF